LSVIFLVVPLATLVVLGAVIAFVVSVRRGQFDDLDTPALRMLYDETSTHVEHDRRKDLRSAVHDDFPA
jgi:cbb3-type cytochrome oxidase maturation protein